jgi:hypothetical protein
VFEVFAEKQREMPLLNVASMHDILYCVSSGKFTVEFPSVDLMAVPVYIEGLPVTIPFHHPSLYSTDVLQVIVQNASALRLEWVPVNNTSL